MIKTVSLTAGTETKVEISGGYNVGVINRTTDMLYASKKSGIVAGADDVAAIPAGDSYVIRAADDTVYLLATAAGDVQLESLGVNEVFKIAATRTSSGGGGGTVDDVARQAIASHANNEDIHLTAEKAIEAAATAISNPNLLINRDFAINQRGAAEYSGNYTYGVDHWQCQNDGVMTVTGSGIKVGFLPSVSSGGKSIIRQCIENCERICGKTCTLSVYIKELSAVGAQLLVMATKSDGSMVYPGSKRVTSDGIIALTFVVPYDISALYVWLYGADMRVAGETANSYTVFGWAKLEIGGVATPYTPPDPATELMKCQRYYQVRSTGDIDPLDLRPSMAAITDIKQRSDGNYEYIAEL